MIRPPIESGAAWDTFRAQDPVGYGAYEGLAGVPWATGQLPHAGGPAP